MIDAKCGVIHHRSSKRCKPCPDKPEKIGSDGLLKFSGYVPGSEVAPIVSYLADTGLLAASPFPFAIGYPFALERRIQNVSVNLPVAITAGTLLVRILKNDMLIPGWTVNYGGTDPLMGVQTLAIGPVTFAAGDRLDVHVTSTDGTTHLVSATIGLV